MSNSIMSMRKMRSLLEQIKSHWLLMSSREVDILKEYALKGRFLIIAYAVTVYSAACMFIFSTYIPPFLDIIKPLNESRPMKRAYSSNYFLDEEKYFFFLLFHENLVEFSNMTTIICVDIMYVKFVEQTCGIFSVLRYRLENIIKNSDTARSCSKRDEEITNEISLCIAYHRNAITYVETIESIYGVALFIQILMCMALLSTTGYVTAIKLETFEEFVQVLPFALGQILHAFYNILPGQKLIDSSEEIGHSVYGLEWYRMPIKAQKLLLLIMLRSHRPCKIRAFGGSFALSMETFSASMKTSFSYFTVLLSMRN
ncbi:odorant receptor 67a-like [Belonocnema kinseyi]|uniref:odorant receptor 67a-like n=1 Tax=Belonocnema kinseyi TaxID=2817044 RepID=UPI00143DC07D|nr:odorant receptor 67a-like [Belonocnema kinseyi]